MIARACPYCGAPAPLNGARFCAMCGAPLGGTVEGAEAERIIARMRTSVPRFVQDLLYGDEAILGAFSASIFDHHHREDLKHDKFVLTTDRIIYYRTSFFHKGFKEIPYSAITGVGFNKGLIHGKVVVQAPGMSLELSGIGNDDAAFAEAVIAGRRAGRRFIPE